MGHKSNNELYLIHGHIPDSAKVFLIIIRELHLTLRVPLRMLRDHLRDKMLQSTQ